MEALFPWVGGKKALRAKIDAIIPEDTETYCEVFGGAGWLLFHKERAGVLEVYNDANQDLVNVFRFAKNNPEALIAELSPLIVSRAIFNDYREYCRLPFEASAKRAAALLYILWFGYGAKIYSPNFGGIAMNNWKAEYLKRIFAISERLKNVVIENLDYKVILKNCENIKKNVLMYLDPPYIAENYYTGTYNGKNRTVAFSEEDIYTLNKMLKNTSKKFILSYNDHPLIRELYNDFNIREAERQNNLKQRYIKECETDARYKELLISNF